MSFYGYKYDKNFKITTLISSLGIKIENIK